MILTEDTAVPVSALPILEFKEHLRLGTGFLDDGIQDGLIASYLKASMDVIEANTNKVTLTRNFLLKQSFWRKSQEYFTLPVSPVSKIKSFGIRDHSGVIKFLDVSEFSLDEDISRPRVKSVKCQLPNIPENGHAEIIFTAGFGPSWKSIPNDLALAIFLLAANFYENRHYNGNKDVLSPMIQSLIKKWKTVRVFSGE